MRAGDREPGSVETASTVTAPMASKVIGACAVPETEIVVPVYSPGSTTTVWPGWTALAASAIVQNGSLSLPGPLSEQTLAPTTFWLST